MALVDPAVVVLSVLAGSLLLFLTDRVRYELVALGVVVVLAGTGTLTPAEAFQGFASEPVAVVAALFAFGAALARWGVGDALARVLLAGGRASEAALVLRIVLVSALLASVMSDAAVVAILMPIVGAAARARRIPLARLVLPISYGAFLGDLLLVVGSAKNLALNGAVLQHGGTPFAMFDFTHFGLLVLAAGALFVAGPGRALLPARGAPETLSERYRVPRFLTEVQVEPGSALVHRPSADAEPFERRGVRLVSVLRPGESAPLAPGPDVRLRARDTLVLQGEPEAIGRLRDELGLAGREAAEDGARALARDAILAEIVVPPGSPLAGMRLEPDGFLERRRLAVQAVAHRGQVRTERLAGLRLEVGDTLLVRARSADLERVARERVIVVLTEHRPPRLGRPAWTTVALLALVLLVAGVGALPLSVAAVGGALGLVALRCLPAAGALREVDWSVVLLLGGMLALGRAFEKHGLAEAVAEALTSASRASADPRLAIALLLLVATLLAQATTSVAAVVVLAPVALSMAAALEVSDRPLLMAVLVGANCAFLSPVANAANAMVAGPGGLRYRDFLRLGLPLTLLVLVLATFTLPVLF